MTAAEREMTRRWGDHWKALGPMMDQFRSEDLAALTEADRGRMFNDIMLHMPITPRHDDGLLEQQRHFRKLAAWKS